MSFTELGLSDKVLAAVTDAGYLEPTPIQSGAIPHVLQRRDVLGIAQTGTGKTASFSLPMLTLLEKGRARARMPRTLVLEPTRELAAQVDASFRQFGSNHKLNVALLIGGVSFAEQDRKLDRGADILIATPGRLLDHFERGKLLLTGVEILVIDEADRMLDMGFIPDIERILKLIPFTRQTLFFSATMPKEIQRLVDSFLHNPERVEVARPASTNDTLSQRTVKTGSKPFEKRAALRDLLASEDGLTNAIIFCNRKRDVATLARSLERHGLNAGALHGDMDQRARMAMLESFTKGNTALLVASDVAARGLDIPNVSHVFNFDVPSHAEDYVHRVGRTGRAGRTGTAITLVTHSDRRYLEAIEKLIGHKIDSPNAPSASPSEPVQEEVKSAVKDEVKDEAPVNAAKEEVKDEARTPRRRSRKRGGDKRSSEAKSEASVSGTGDRQPATPAVEKPVVKTKAAEPEQPKPARAARQNNNGGNRRKKEDQAFGRSEYVPAFLLRPIRKKQPAE